MGLDDAAAVPILWSASRSAMRLCLLLLLGLASPTALAQSVYAVFEVENGSARLVSAAPAPDDGRQPVGGSGPERATVRVLDGDRVAFTTDATGGALRGEFHGAPSPDGGFAVDAHHLEAERWAFAVRIPERELGTGGVVEVSVASPARRTAGEPLRVSADDLRARARSRARRASTSKRLLGDGDSGNRIDLLVVGDGYTEAQESQFFADADRVARAFLDITPYREYVGRFAATALFVASNESGADQPTTGDCVGNGKTVDTAFGATYCTSGIDRLLTVQTGRVYAAAEAVPEWDQILVIVNDTKYGGAGGAVSVISMNDAAVDLARHEVGHTFGGLADEYTYGTARTCADPNCPPNVTNVTDRSALKWGPWVDASTPLPTPDEDAYDDAPGVFEGAYYTPTGLYRPHRNCMMRSLGVPFCPICREHIVGQIYGGGWYRYGQGYDTPGVDPIDPGSEQPTLGGTISINGPTDFSAGLLDPAGTPPLDVTWRVDDLEVSTDRTFTFAPDTPGTYTVTMAVADPTPLVHPSRDRAFLASSRTWTVEATGVSVGADEPAATSWGLHAPAPNPARQLAMLGYALATAGDARIEVVDGLGRRVALLADGPHVAGEHTVRLRTDELAPGVYLVRLVTAEGADVKRLSVVR